MPQLFKKLAYFTDIHFGRNGNNDVALQDNLDFIRWFIAQAKARGCETMIFGGDWHDQRHSIHVGTLNASLAGLDLLNEAFEKVYFIPGNHDLFFRDRRDVSSIGFADRFSRIEVVGDICVRDGVAFIPWLVGDEGRGLKGLSAPYGFAHLEVPGFLMNAKVEMPDSDHATGADQFAGIGTVYTGHFHMRQRKGNIVYTGNVMPFTFSDNWDPERGAMFLDWGAEHEFVSWPDQPLYRTMSLSDLLNDPDSLLCPRLTARVTIDVDVSYEEAQVVKETMTEAYGLRKMELIQKTKSDEVIVDPLTVPFQTIDQIMQEALTVVKGDGLDSNMLLDLYRGLSSH